MSDEGFREIQLNGKQLIFLFMAVTVVLVVTFLFGVLVGRGVREGAATTEIASNEVVPDPGHRAGGRQRRRPPSPARQLSVPSARGAAGRRAQLCRAPAPRHASRRKPETGAGGSAAHPLRSFRSRSREERLRHRLLASKPAPPHLRLLRPRLPCPHLRRRPTDRPANVSAGSQPPRPRRPIRPVQALRCRWPRIRDRRDADTLAKQLAAKGYPAFVMDPVKGTSTTLFRVRVGKYKTLKDAEGVRGAAREGRSSSRTPGLPGNQLHETTATPAGRGLGKRRDAPHRVPAAGRIRARLHARRHRKGARPRRSISATGIW